ncbi:MAG: hypothetical protein ABFR62_04580 [Bacteroidota bacterium]
MEKSYIQLKSKDGIMLKGPKKETIDFLLSYSKALKVIKGSKLNEFELILN